MKIEMICFTARGAGIHRLLCGRFRDTGTECRGYVPRRFWKPEWEAEGILPQDRPLSEWTGSVLGQKGALVFINAVGIIVRATAPYIRGRMTDPPVVAADEAGHFCIPLLLGRTGGANEPAERMMGWPSGILVVATATDVDGVFTVDIFAARNGFRITDRRETKGISAWLLDGEEVDFLYNSECHGAGGAKSICRHNICMSGVCGHNIWVTFRSSEKPSFLRLVPKMIVVGVGCGKGIPPNVLGRRVLETLEDSDIDPAAVETLSTIGIKAGEAAVSQLAGRYGQKLRTFTAGELLAVKGEFEGSGFVGTAVGVGNVCEKSCTAGGGILLIHKRAGEGMTMVTAIEPVVRAGRSQ